MPHVRQRVIAFAATLLFACGEPALAERLFTLTDDGQTFLYRARPGDHPSAVAEMFGIPSENLSAFLAANGIRDATRVGTGFTYRIPNTAVHALGERVAALTEDNARLDRTLVEATARVEELTGAADEARRAAAQAEAHAARLARLDALWPWAKTAIALLALATAGAVWTALAALRRHTQAETYARALARDLEGKRRANLAERQESGRRILDLENRLRALEAQVGPRVVISGRGNG